MTPKYSWKRPAAGSANVSGIGVVCLCTYRTTRVGPWTDADFAAVKLIRALKGKPVNGWARVPVGTHEWVRFDETSRQLAFEAFGRLATARVDWRAVEAAVLVPIPNSNCTTSSGETPRTRLLADAVVSHARDLRLSVVDALRWSEPTGAAHECSARRYPEQLYRLFRLTGPLERKCQVVLIDDVITTGGHMRAAEAFLRELNIHVLGGLCAGISDARSVASDAFGMRIEQLDPFLYDVRVLNEI